MWPDLRKRTTYPRSLDFANILCGGFVLGVTTNPGVLADRNQRILSLFSAKGQVFIPRSRAVRASLMSAIPPHRLTLLLFPFTESFRIIPGGGFLLAHSSTTFNIVLFLRPMRFCGRVGVGRT